MTGRDSAETSGYLPSYSALALSAGASTRSAYSSRASMTIASIAPAAERPLADRRPSRRRPSWPTSTASATTSTPHSSAIHRTATEVSRPPEYASTTRLRHDRSLPLVCLEPGERRRARRRPSRHPPDSAHDQEQRVVAGDGAEHVGEAGPVERGADHVRASPAACAARRGCRCARPRPRTPPSPGEVVVGTALAPWRARGSRRPSCRRGCAP